jgi:hypothetical protein
MFGYLKLMLILFLLISIPRVWKRPIYVSLILIFAFVLVDDAFQVHERGGMRIAEALDLQPFLGLRPIDPGELLVWTMVGVPLLAAAAFAIVRSPKDDRANGLLLLGALAVLALFAVVTDMAHVVLRGAFWGANDLFTVIEDGGEQFTLSLTCGSDPPRRARPRAQARRAGLMPATPGAKSRQLSGRDCPPREAALRGSPRRRGGRSRPSIVLDVDAQPPIGPPSSLVMTTSEGLGGTPSAKSGHLVVGCSKVEA